MNITSVTAAAVYNIYGYDPNVPAAYICAVLFGIATISVTSLNIWFKSWFMIPVSVAGLMEFAGFLIRPFSTTQITKYIPSVLFILLSPTVYAASDYTIISRM